MAWRISKQEKLDVDARFLLANERTLLAWVRTALTIEAGGLALVQINLKHKFIGIGVLLLGALVAIIGFTRYRAADRAIRAGRLPHAGIGPAVEVAMVVGVAVVLAIAELTFLH